MEWNSLPNVLSIAGGAWIIVSVLTIIGRIRKGMWKLGFKEVWQSSVFLIGFIWIPFALIFLGLTVPPAMDLIENGFSQSNPSSSTLWVIDTMPLFYTSSGLVAISWIAWKFLSYKPKYSEEEKTFLRNDKLRWKKKLGWFGRLIKVEEE